MSKGRSYFALLEELKAPGCPICSLFIKDSQSYLESLLYENVLDVPTRLNLMESFGFCNWHAWQIPKSPVICSPTVGFSIFASDLLRKFNLLVGAMIQGRQNKSVLSTIFKTGAQRLLSQMKARVCPVCSHVAASETFHLKDLLDFIEDNELRDVYSISRGICLPHFFVIAKNYSDHPNFLPLVKLQLGKSGALRQSLEEFIRKQDYRLQSEITADEAKAWRVAMEFLAGKPGVFNNERRADLAGKSRLEAIGARPDEIKTAAWFGSVSLGDLVARIKTAKQVIVYQKQPLPQSLVKPLRQIAADEKHPNLEIVAEDLSDVNYLRDLYSSGFDIFYGLGLPRQAVIFIGSGRGFVLEDKPGMPGFKALTAKHAENLYYRLLWCRFGHAVSLGGSVKEIDPEQRLFCLTLDRDREVWCRLHGTESDRMPDAGQKVSVFCWEKWHTHILDVLELRQETSR